jgi:competence protein ComEA
MLPINNKDKSGVIKTMRGIKLFSLAFLFAFSGILYAGQVNVNTADAKKIASELSGIGAVRAEAIVIYRKENGKFKSIDELVKVRGIGEKTIEKNRSNIVLSIENKSS